MAIWDVEASCLTRIGVRYAWAIFELRTKPMKCQDRLMKFYTYDQVWFFVLGFNIKEFGLCTGSITETRGT